MTKQKHIAFVGDSFCASVSADVYKVNGVWRQKNAGYPGIVADHYGAKIHAHGYPGKSWWYSRSKFLDKINKQPEFLDNIIAMIFCHTESNRINSDNEYAFPWNHYGDRPDSSYKNYEDQQIAHAQSQWAKHLLDFEFQEWAHINWFREITREWGHIKQVHFHCFPWTVSHDYLLSGQRFVTPLVHVSLGELDGSADQINYQMSHADTRKNHLSDDNNLVLAEIIIDALDNYKDQCQPSHMSKFKNIVNQNYENFPYGDFGTHP